MEYIRTKNGIYTYDEVRPYFLDRTQKLYMNNEQKIGITEKEIIRRADTIEKLCDGVIEKCLSGDRFCPIEIFNKQEAIECMNLEVNKGYKEFYYGIFVEHNNKIDFISVAKMDNDGTVKLIL